MKDQNVEDFIKKIVELNLNEKKTEKLLFDFYKIVASHYHNRVPEKIYNIFVTNFPSFESYVENIMILFKNSQAKMNNEISNISSGIEEMEEMLRSIENDKISIRKNKARIETKMVYRYPRVHTLYGYEGKTECKKVLVKTRIPSTNIDIIRKQIDTLISKSKDQEKLEADLINLFILQVQEDSKVKYGFEYDKEKFVFEDIYQTFVNKYKPFEEIFKRLNNRDDEIQELKEKIANNNQILDGILIERKWTDEQIIEIVK